MFFENTLLRLLLLHLYDLLIFNDFLQGKPYRCKIYNFADTDKHY